jgi:hypothetical protein
MKVSTIAAFLFSVPLVSAYPRMKSLVSDIKRRAAQADTIDGDAPAELIGDLKAGATTPVGQSIANILTGVESGQSAVAGYLPPLLGTAACKKDTCCVWSYISLVMSAAFTGPTGRCNSLARQAIRLGFHDAGTWSKSLAAAGQDFGGADGSIALAGESTRAENHGLEGIIAKAIAVQKTFGVSMADLIQFSAIHAVVTCPLGPRIRFFAGRKDSTTPSPNGLLPGVNDSADKLIALFQDKTIPPHQLAALLGAHSTSEQFFVDTKNAGQAQDSTPGIWDASYYNQTLQPTAPKKVFRFNSDLVLSKDPRVNDEWLQFAGVGGQGHWNEDYATAYTRLSLLGVNNINNMTECSK